MWQSAYNYIVQQLKSCNTNTKTTIGWKWPTNIPNKIQTWRQGKCFFNIQIIEFSGKVAKFSNIITITIAVPARDLCMSCHVLTSIMWQTCFRADLQALYLELSKLQIHVCSEAFRFRLHWALSDNVSDAKNKWKLNIINDSIHTGLSKILSNFC